MDYVTFNNEVLKFLKPLSKEELEHLVFEILHHNANESIPEIKRLIGKAQDEVYNENLDSDMFDITTG